MYKSPIELITKPMYTEMINEQENYILQAIQEMGVNVDKEELLKALKYDREQYNKGYMDGVKEFAERLCEGRVSNDPVVIAVKVELEMEGEQNEKI